MGKLYPRKIGGGKQTYKTLKPTEGLIKKNKKKWAWRLKKCPNKLRRGGFSSYVVFDIGLHIDVAEDLLSSLHSQIVVQVEYSLFPVGVGGLWTWGEEKRDRFNMTSRNRRKKIAIKESNVFSQLSKTTCVLSFTIDLI